MEWVSGNIFIRPLGGGNGLKAGESLRGHAHNFDHTSIFFNGRWRIRRWRPTINGYGHTEFIETDDIDREGPFHLLIEAGCKHELTFMGPGVGQAWCVYSHRTRQGDVSVEYTGWGMAYQ